MANIIKIIIIAVLAVGVLVGSFYLYYNFAYKPSKLDKIEAQQVAEQVAAGPTPDPTKAILESIIVKIPNEDPLTARGAIQKFIATYPDSTELERAYKVLGDLNSSILFSSTPSPEKETYTVASGDALVKIAKKLNTTAEAIMFVNSLPSINLQIGQQLQVPKMNPSLVLDTADKTLTLLNDGSFFKKYAVLSLQIPATKSVDTKVADTFAMADGNKRVAFGSKEYPSAERWIVLDKSGISIRSMPEPTDANPNPAPPAGIVLSPSDVGELFMIVKRGTPLSIQTGAPAPTQK